MSSQRSFLHHNRIDPHSKLLFLLEDIIGSAIKSLTNKNIVWYLAYLCKKKTYIYFLSNLVISVTNIYWFIFFLRPIRHILAGLFILEGGLCTAMLYNRGAHTSYRPNIMLEKCGYFQPEFWFFLFFKVKEMGKNIKSNRIFQAYFFVYS